MFMSCLSTTPLLVTLPPALHLLLHLYFSITIMHFLFFHVSLPLFCHGDWVMVDNLKEADEDTNRGISIAVADISNIFILRLLLKLPR